jgi:hypothetical protein
MRILIPASRHRIAGLAGACVLVLGGAAGLAVAGAGGASAATCVGGSTPTTCAAVGTATLGGGALTLTAPDTLTWGATLGGAAQTVTDVVTADQSLTVDDATGSGAGWSITATATPFTTGGAGAVLLPDTGTLSVNGDAASATATTAPDAVCTVVTECTVPTGNLVPSYPVPIATDGATTATLYTAAAATGIGSVILGSADPIGWWLSLPYNTLAGAYTSTVSLNVVSGP